MYRSMCIAVYRGSGGSRIRRNKQTCTIPSAVPLVPAEAANSRRVGVCSGGFGALGVIADAGVQSLLIPATENL